MGHILSFPGLLECCSILCSRLPRLALALALAEYTYTWLWRRLRLTYLGLHSWRLSVFQFCLLAFHICWPRLSAPSSICYTLSVMSMFLVSTMSTAKAASDQIPPRIISRKRVWGGPAFLFFYFFCAHLFFFWCNWPSEWVRNMRGDEVVAFCFYSAVGSDGLPSAFRFFPGH